MKVLVEKLEEYRAQEQSMRKAILTAQRTADAMVAEAEKKAAQLMNNAQAAAETKTVDDYGRLAVTLLGSGQGYYIRDGRCIPITWSRDAEDAPFRYTTQGGEPLELGAGKTYVAITPPESPLELG